MNPRTGTARRCREPDSLNGTWWGAPDTYLPDSVVVQLRFQPGGKSPFGADRRGKKEAAR